MTITPIFYIVNNKKGDSLESPNCFFIETAKEVILKDIIRLFPLSKIGDYHFRFRIPEGRADSIWIDLASINDKVPYYNDYIYMKCLRCDQINIHSKILQTVQNTVPHIAQNTVQNNNQNTVQNTVQNNNQNTVHHLNKSQSQTLQQTPITSPDINPPEKEKSKDKDKKEKHKHKDKDKDKEKKHKKKGDLQSVDDKPTTPQNINSNNIQQNKPIQQSSIPVDAPVDISDESTESEEEEVDLFGGNKVTDKSLSQFTGTSYDGKSPEVIKAMKKREKELRKKQEEAKLEMERQKDMLIKSQEDKDKAIEVHGAAIKLWAEENGVKRDIRGLLSTLQNVLWEGSGWTNINIGDLLADSKVKMGYFKASRIVHPDKTVDCTSEQKLIAERIFDALNQAWNTFQGGNNAL